MITNLFICRSQIFFSDANDDFKQYIFITVFLTKRLEKSFISNKKSMIMIKQIVKMNKKDNCDSKLSFSWETDYVVKKIKLQHYFHL